MRRRNVVMGGLAFAVVLVAAGTFGVVRYGSPDQVSPPSATAAVVTPAALTGRGAVSGASLDEIIVGLQTRLELTPQDYTSWATLGLAYVQQARVTVDPSFYPRAEGVLQRSLEINDDENFLVYAGLSALASARHDFASAKQHADRGLEINSYSALLYGALSDAEIQLGRYDEAFEAVQSMVDLSPDTSSLTRASYTWELRGELDRATDLMLRALDDAPTLADRAFVLYQLGELEFNAGDPNAALEQYRNALAASPDDLASLAGKAKAEAALGQVETALDDYATLVARAPVPSYVLEYGELLESLGRIDEATEQYDVFIATQKLFSTNGVEPDPVAALFEADHGDRRQALEIAAVGIEVNPFLGMYDAYAWALHRNGRNEEALAAIDRALALGLPNARFHFHAGMISLALDDEQRASEELTTALAINPYFHPLDATAARATLADLERSE